MYTVQFIGWLYCIRFFERIARFCERKSESVILSLLKSQANHSHRSFLKSDESNSLTSLFWAILRKRAKSERAKERISNPALKERKGTLSSSRRKGMAAIPHRRKARQWLLWVASRSNLCLSVLYRIFREVSWETVLPRAMWWPSAAQSPSTSEISRRATMRNICLKASKRWAIRTEIFARQRELWKWKS